MTEHAPVGDKTSVSTSFWSMVHTVGSVLVAVAAVPYALVVMTAPLDLAAPAILQDLGLPSPTTLARALNAATCGGLAAAVLAAGVIVRRLVSPWVVLVSGLAALSAAALWVRSIGNVAQLAVLRGLQGLGAGAVLVACLALVGALGQHLRAVLSGAWVLAVVAGAAALPWATYRLPFSAGTEWRSVLSPYPLLFVLVLAGSAAVAVAALAGSARARAWTGGDEHAGRLGWPLVLPAGLAVAAFLIKPGGGAASEMLTFYSLLVVTTLVVVTLAGLVLIRPLGWRPGITLPLVSVVAVVLAVTAANAFNVVLFADVRWPLPARHVLPTLAGAALVGGLACVAAVLSPPRTRRSLAVVGLLVASGGSLLPLWTTVTATAAGTATVWTGAGLALGAVVQFGGAASGAWTGAAFVIATTLAKVDSDVLRTVLTPSTRDDASPTEQLRALHDGFVSTQRVWIVCSAVLLLAVAALLARLRVVPAQPTDEGEQEPTEVPGEAAVRRRDEAEDAEAQMSDAAYEVEPAERF